MTVRPRRTLLAAALVGALAAASACGGGNATSSSGSGEKITLVVKTFSQFGYDELFKEYEATHSNITIKEENVAKLGDYIPKLQKWMATGSGAGDVVAIEEGIIAQYMAKPDGLPTDRDQVGALWPTWDAYLSTGKKFMAANTGAHFFDTSGSVYLNLLIQQGDHTYYDTSNKLVIDSNPGVKSAWDKTIDMVSAGLSANIAQFSPQWNAGFKNGTFATLPCPSWMLATIEKQAGPENAGKWDVTKVPGNGGVRGGSFLAVPKQSGHQKEAAELVKFLTSAKGQTAAFKAKNNFPSSPQAIDDPAVQGFTNAYFNSAPVGKIFGASVKALRPVYLGPANNAVGDRVTNALTAVEQGKLKPDEAWTNAVEEAKRLAK